MSENAAAASAEITLSDFNREDCASLNWSFGLYERLRNIIMASSIEDAASRTSIELLEALRATSVTIAMKASDGFYVLASYIPSRGFDEPLTGKSVGDKTPPRFRSRSHQRRAQTGGLAVEIGTARVRLVHLPLFFRRARYG